MTFAMSAPSQAGDFVQGSAVASAGGGREELFGEHSFSVRDQGPAEGARTISDKAPPQPKMALATIQVFGEYLDCDIT
jgi:hypothetical protein